MATRPPLLAPPGSAGQPGFSFAPGPKPVLAGIPPRDPSTTATGVGLAGASSPLGGGPKAGTPPPAAGGSGSAPSSRPGTPGGGLQPRRDSFAGSGGAPTSTGLPAEGGAVAGFGSSGSSAPLIQQQGSMDGRGGNGSGSKPPTPTGSFATHATGRGWGSVADLGGPAGSSSSQDRREGTNSPPNIGGGGVGTVYHLLVTVDRDTFPHKLVLQVQNLTELIDRLQTSVCQGQSIATVSYWDDDFSQFVPMRSLQPLNQLGCKGKVHVSTGGVRMVEVTEASDALEWAALRDQVDKLGPPKDGYVYELVGAHRIVHPGLEQGFQQRRKQLLDPTVRTTMLFYTNNARPSEQCVQYGFALPERGTSEIYGGGIVFASDIDAQLSIFTNLKFLLCEVAVGRTYTCQSGDRKVVFDHTNYDSLLNLTHRYGGLQRLEEWVVFRPEQAIPRYILTCSAVKGNMRSNWNPTALGCDQHPGESLKLWCVDCRRLMCPYCMTIGQHRGHNVRDTAEVAVFEKQVVSRMYNTLENTVRRRQNEVAEVERLRVLQNNMAKKGEETVRQVVRDLHQLLANEEIEMLSDLQKRKENVNAEYDRQQEGVQVVVAELQKKCSTVKSFVEIPVESSQQGRMEFLSRLQGIIDLLQSKPTYDDPGAIDIKSVPQININVSYEEARAGIQSLSICSGLASSSDDGAAHTAQGRSGSGGAAGGIMQLGASVPRSALNAEVGKVRDMETGYIWVIPNAVQHFHSHQTKDIFSDVFSLLGCNWELRLTPQPAEHFSVFLHAANHVHRVDFKVTIFSPRGWYSRQAKNWADTFKGRGWGIKPFIEIKELQTTYINDNCLKLVVTPTSGLY